MRNKKKENKLKLVRKTNNWTQNKKTVAFAIYSTVSRIDIDYVLGVKKRERGNIH